MGTGLGETTADIAFGGAFYASVQASSLGLSVGLDDLPRLVETGRSIAGQLNASGVARQTGSASMTGLHQFVLEARDVLGTGFSLPAL